MQQISVNTVDNATNKYDMDSHYIKASVACYFRYKRQCPLICFERAVKEGEEWGYNPDISIIDKQRRLIEVEVKISLSDLKNDYKKRIWNNRGIFPVLYPMPHQFYYAVPTKLKEKATEVIKAWKQEGKKCGEVGLLVVMDKYHIGRNDVFVHINAPINNAKKISIRDAIRLARHQSGTICSLSVALAKHSNKSRFDKSYIDIEDEYCI